MSIGLSCVRRRIDTDFVNITPILDSFEMPLPGTSSLPGSVVVSRGSAAVCGTWAPLAVAQDIFRDRDMLRIFLSDDLHQRFPQALQDFHSSNSRERSFVQFGPNFLSTAEAKRKLLNSFRMDLPTRDVYEDVEDDDESQSPWDHWLLSPVFSTQQGTTPFVEPTVEPQTPLSPTEEEMFHTLCAVSDWDPAPVPAPCPTSPTPVSAPALTPPTIPLPCPSHVEMPAAPCRDKPLRRSRRTVVRAGSRPRTRSAVKISKAVHS